jgi:hypothetical protein
MGAETQWGAYLMGQRTARTGYTADRYDPDVGLRMRKCARCNIEQPVTEFAGGNPNCAECRTHQPAEVLGAKAPEPLPVYGPPEPALRACADPEHIGERLLPIDWFIGRNGQRTKFCRPCNKRRWTASRRGHKSRHLR